MVQKEMRHIRFGILCTIALALPSAAYAAGSIKAAPYAGEHRAGFASLAEAATWACAASARPLHADPAITCDGSYVVWPGSSPTNVPPRVGWSRYYTAYYKDGQVVAGMPIGYFFELLSKNTCADTGNPISSATGLKMCSPENDFTGGSIAFIRTYSSGRTPFKRDLGVGWSASYFQRISFGQEGDWQLAVVRRPNGQEFSFERTLPAEAWTTEADLNFKLSSVPSSTNYELRTPEDNVEIYDENGRLQSIVLRSGLVQTLSYNGDGQLAAVTDSFGRTLRFTYHPAGALFGANNLSTATDAAGNTVSYTYDANNNLETVTLPGGAVRRYHYNEAAHTGGAALPNAMTGITDENNVRFATYAYDSSGRAISTEHANGVEKYTLTYVTQHKKTEVTDPLGIKRTHTFQTIQGVVKTVAVSQPCPTCVGQSMAYDSNGNIQSRTDFRGSRNIYVHDLARNLETSRTEADNDSAGNKRTMQTDWHASFRVPTERRTYNAANALVAK